MISHLTLTHNQDNVQSSEKTEKLGVLARMKEDIAAVLERDPSMSSWLEVLFFATGLHAVWFYRVAHALWQSNHHVLASIVSKRSRKKHGVEIHPAATIGRRLVIDHGLGLVVGATAIIGDDVLLYQGVTLGMTGHHGGKRHPTLGNGVVVGANATVLGNITVADNAKVGAGAVVVRDVPAGSTVVGVPAHVINRCPVSQALVLRLFENEDTHTADWSCAL